MADEVPERPAIPGWRRATLPLPTIGVFLVLAVCLWVNAAINSYRFNVAVAAVGSVPLVVLLLRGMTKARALRRGET